MKYLSIHPTNTVLLMIFLGVLGSCGIARADAWRTDYGTNLEIGRTDNFRLTETNEIETSITRLQVFADIVKETEVSQLGLAFGASANDYSASSIEADSNRRLALNAGREAQRWSALASLSFDSRSTTETELLDTGVLSDGNRDTTEFEASLGHSVSERIHYLTSIISRDIGYEDGVLTDFQETSISLNWRYQLDETSLYGFDLQHAEYDPDNENSTDINAIRIAYRWNPQESTVYRLSLGYNDVNRPRDSETGADYLAAIDYQVDERNSLAAVVKKVYTSSGAGEVRDEDNLSIRWAHMQSDRIQNELDLVALSNDDRDFFAIEFGTSYQYTRELRVTAKLRHQQQNSESSDATSNRILLSLFYTPD